MGTGRAVTHAHERADDARACLHGDGTAGTHTRPHHQLRGCCAGHMEMGLREHTHAPITSCVAVVLGSARMATEASGTVREGRVLLWSVGWTHRADGWAVAAAAVERGQVAVGCGW